MTMAQNKYHIPALLHETIEGLSIKPSGVYVDVTLGGGGHSQAILQKLGDNGKLLVFDKDKDAIQNLPQDKRVLFVQHDFRFLSNFLDYYGIEKVDGLLGDLGVSFHDFDTKTRGFSFRFEEPLDMRMNQNQPLSAKEVLNEYTQEKLASILKKYGEVKNSWTIARKFIDTRKTKPIKYPKDLIEALKGSIPKKQENQFLSKIFQAIRIEVNDEMRGLQLLLEQTPKRIKKNGRLAIISYHSLEDRMVKNFLRNGNIEGKEEKDFYGNRISPWQTISNKPITPSAMELSQNNRARSAKLRIGIRTS